MYKRILVPSDGSESSRHALTAALGLARKFDSEVELFHVTQNQLAYYGYNEGFTNTIDPDLIKKNGEQALEFALKGIDIRDVRFSKKHVSGNPAESILDEIKREFDLVIMGTRGHSTITGAILGSVTQRVLANSFCPILVVR